ncbi:MAG: pantoate--beta-alanine ligase [Phycisphaerales bacterium]|nr:pantoate--beta-alanine ligase [Phycisphaerales bacterium]
MQIVWTAADLEEFHGGVCVPTMGALHEGHLSLIRRAREEADAHAAPLPVAVTIFVNPAQFAPGEDFARYPRTFEADCSKAESCGADVVFAPEVGEVYPQGVEAPIDPRVVIPEVARRPGLEEKSRPQFFIGVCRVVHRLFEMVKPRAAVFGEKDYQQLLTIRAMARDMALTVEILSEPTVREEDGLAMSSRNVYLAPPQRKRALALSKALKAARGASSVAEAESAMRSILLANQVEIDYAVVRDAHTLMPIESLALPARALVAGRVGPVRLIDNMAV